MERCVYFEDTFFSSGKTDIYNAEHQKQGVLDLRSAFSSGVSIEDASGRLIVEGNFPFLSGKWVVKQSDGRELGVVKSSFALFSKKYHYITNVQNYEIEAPAFSKEYTVFDENKEEVATFKKVNGFFQASAYELKHTSDRLLTEELIAVVMGVNAIEKRKRSSAGAGAGGSGG
ncbi:hypothetical protein ABE65_010835 [Fictibacillus phosphorivorans]|uniref:Uncharacterized protein n=1 Tax=Fictibacillus phosphorivorans TaxID=1221500 RepID=A0A160IM68_9BACL|nr:hypothetical protein [Fictibacillus phosphorivorans]ANC77271.1 hypothetical protein ABE65_010835 [Fictibacillus phosphorivorans]